MIKFLRGLVIIGVIILWVVCGRIAVKDEPGVCGTISYKYDNVQKVYYEHRTSREYLIRVKFPDGEEIREVGSITYEDSSIGDTFCLEQSGWRKGISWGIFGVGCLILLLFAIYLLAIFLDTIFPLTKRRRNNE